MPLDDPILVCGPRRSGTTLMLAVLCSDARAHPPQAEAELLVRLVGGYAWAVEHYERYGRPFFADPATLRGLYAEACRRFLDAARERLSPGGLLVLKHPHLVSKLGALRDLVPDVRVVVTVRDPRDQVASELTVARRAGMQRGRRAWIAVRARRISRAAVRRMAERYRDDVAGLGSGALVVRYEDLVQDFEAVRRRLETELGVTIAFDPATAWPATAGLRPLRDSPSWSDKYGSAVDAGSVGRWRRDLSRAEARLVERVCGAALERFGYR